MWTFYFEIRTGRCVTSWMDGLDISLRTPGADPYADTRVMNLIKEEPNLSLPSTWKVETEGSCKMLHNLQGSTRRHLRANITLHDHKTSRNRKMRTKDNRNSTESVRN